MPTARETYALLRMLSRYGLTVAGLVRRELRGWETCARAIPNPTLRTYAVAKLHDERLNAEAAATFACLVGPRHRATATRLMVAFEVMYDYLDGVTEQPVNHPLRNGRRLHRALTAAIDPDATSARDYYRHHPAQGDGGYLDQLIATCQTNLQRLPAAAVVRPLALRAAARCGEAQTRTHAVASLGRSQLARWAARQACEGFAWWECAAGATASLGVHALFAAAGRPSTTRPDAERIDAAYQPAICALATLLDSLIDHDHDVPGSDHRYVAYYATNSVAANRIARIAGEAATRARALPNGSSHGIIVVGIACFYLSAPGATGAFARPATNQVLQTVGPIASPIIAVLQHRRRRARHASAIVDHPRQMNP